MLTIGDAVFIEEKVDEHVVYYKSRIVDQLDQTIHLDIPFNERSGRNAMFTRETSYKLFFLTKKSVIYTCQLKYLYPLKESIPVLVFTKPNENELLIEQRRQFFRIAKSTEITVLPMEEEFIPIQTISQDISAGGVAIHIPKSFEVNVNQELRLKMNLQFENSFDEDVFVEAKIVRIQESDTKEKQLISLMYLNLSGQARQKIIKYTLEQQRLHIKSMKVD